MRHRQGYLLTALAIFIGHWPCHAMAALTGMALSRSSQGEEILTLTFDSPPGDTRAFMVDQPPRLNLDLGQHRLTLPKEALELAGELVGSLSAVEVEGRSRLVVNLARQASWRTRAEGNTLELVLGEGSKIAAPVRAEETPFALDFARGAAGEGRIELTLPAGNVVTDIHRNGAILVVGLPGQRFPAGRERRVDVTDFATPVRRIETRNQGKKAKLLVTLDPNAQFTSWQADGKLTIQVVKPGLNTPAQAPATPAARPKAAASRADRLSLNFQNIDVRNLLQVIAEFSGMNIVVSDTVTGSVTLRLKDVPWEEALDLVLQSRDLDQRRMGNIIRVAPREELANHDRQMLESRQQLGNLAPLQSDTFVLRYRSAEDFRKILDDRSLGGSKGGTVLSERGSVLLDPKTNTLIVNDTREVIDKIRGLIRKTDIPVRQVLIEARIVEATDNFSRDLGVKLSFARYSKDMLLGSTLNDDGTLKMPGIGVNLPIKTPYNSVAALFRAGASAVIGLELQAMQAEDKGKVISSPHVLTSDRTEARIEEGQEIPYQSDTGSGTSISTKVEFKKAVLSLKVTPQISPDNTVLMNIDLSKDSANFSQLVQGTPSINTKKITTQVLIENGGTVVIGGIYVEEQSDLQQKVPLLGDIPGIGALFRSKQAANKRRELLVFITPKIIADLLPPTP
ncbi:type IV pilus secretin PilQ [Paludibacterium paludis]|uniref:Fimbrial assembly protein PilQ n=1 Tax=Paludibacterium paludis TaxID=1225769 RepID=A0A918P2Q1_9NEIS|nr:type IV pilus secretin PilQ family protein [Paludibacterium paludis]GGY16556.1 fimbrial assembly protein PilQ [Paludibacterium paludis]